MRTPQELWDAALVVFDAARDLTEPERARFIESRCAGDAELFAEVDSLLTHIGKAGGNFLKPAEIGELAATCERPDPLIGQTIASYAIRSVIARGGMGTVYLSEQSSPRRSVALKVLSQGFWSASGERRFSHEAQILARLQHPHIAQVFEAGTQRLDSGGVARYFAMELVPNAQQITDFADEKKLDVKERLTLFMQVCDAVQYGHSKGVIHRDLKPANILVGSDLPQASGPGSRAVVKVIDFGVARVVDTDVALTTMHTDTGQLIGTLAYMSPEQCDADPLGLDVRSDVYSLGVVLYQLLCGRLPYDVSKTSIAAAATTIRDTEPTRPSLIVRKLRGDLEIVLLKALEKDRSKRYAGVADIARDLRHFLDGEPIEARRSTRWARALRWVVRNPKTVTAVFCLSTILIVTGFTKYFVSTARARPFRLDLHSGRRYRSPENVGRIKYFDSATLSALSGDTLGRWGDRNDCIVFGDLIKSVDSWAGADIVVIGFSDTPKGDFAGRICIFDARRPSDEPLSVLMVDQESLNDMPNDAWSRPPSDPLRKFTSRGFRLKTGALLDIFPQGGDGVLEIVAYYQHNPGSQGVLRIHDLHGDLLFQAWQDGGIFEMATLPESGILVCQAIKNDKRPEDYDPPLDVLHPRVIFGIRPIKGMITNRWIGPTPRSTQVDRWFQPEWYKAFCFSNHNDTRTLSVTFADVDSSAPDYSRVLQLMISLQDVLTPSGNWYTISVLVDPMGEIVRREPLADTVLEGFIENPSLPNPAVRPQDFQLLEWKDENPPCAQISIEFDESGSQQLEPAD